MPVQNAFADNRPARLRGVRPARLRGVRPARLRGVRAARARRALALALAGVCGAALLRARPALANGAFPDSLQILLPADRPQQIVLGTNFGIIISDDGGASWTWTCEQKQTVNGSVYAVGPSPRDRFFALSPLVGLAWSDDDSCSWHTAGGALDRALARDFFPDPSDGSHVLAIGSIPVDGGSSYQLFESRDGGATFGDPLYTAPPAGTLIGVENALTDPKTIYLALYTTTETAPSLHPALVRSTDGGQTWSTRDLEPALGAVKFRIIAVDPADPLTLYVRVSDVDGNTESVAVSRDGGATFTKVLSVGNGVITAFARLASGTVLVGAIVVTYGLGFRSTDGGATFQPWFPVPHLRALAERDGKLYAAAKNYTDGWAIGVSTDEGQTFQPLARYDQVRAIRACAQAACENSCDFQAGAGIWAPAVCQGDGDGGISPPGPEPPGGGKSGGGCGCEIGGGLPPAAAAVGAAVAALAAALGRRRRRAPLRPPAQARRRSCRAS
jgi:hypothetical protein